MLPERASPLHSWRPSACPHQKLPQFCSSQSGSASQSWQDPRGQRSFRNSLHFYKRNVGTVSAPSAIPTVQIHQRRQLWESSTYFFFGGRFRRGAASACLEESATGTELSGTTGVKLPKKSNNIQCEIKRLFCSLSHGNWNVSAFLHFGGYNWSTGSTKMRVSDFFWNFEK